LVIIDHTGLFKSYLGYPTLWANSYSAYLGAFGVSIFFVLSGFLITYLLLEEQQEAPIRIRHFYLRRILRIWPIYYLLVVLGFFVIPHLDFFQVPTYSSDMGDSLHRLLLFVGLAANVAFVYLPTVPFANVLWSVAVEEQFYLFADLGYDFSADYQHQPTFLSLLWKLFFTEKDKIYDHTQWWFGEDEVVACLLSAVFVREEKEWGSPKFAGQAAKTLWSKGLRKAKTSAARCEKPTCGRQARAKKREISERPFYFFASLRLCEKIIRRGG